MEQFIISNCVDGEERTSRIGLEMEYMLPSIGITYEVGEGCFRGQKEKAFLLTSYDGRGGDVTLEYLALKLAQSFNQECIISLSENRGMGLVYPPEPGDIPKYEHLGRWETRDSEPTDRESWTRIGERWLCLI